MVNNKKRINMNIDKDLWDLAGIVLPCNRTEFFEKALSNYINSTDELEILEKEVKELETELNIKRDKIKHIKELRETNSKREENIKIAMGTVARIIKANDCITKQQINHIAIQNDIFKDILEDKIKKEGYKII